MSRKKYIKNYIHGGGGRGRPKRDCEYTVVLTLLDSAHFFLRSAHTLAQCHGMARLNYSNIHKMEKHEKNYKYYSHVQSWNFLTNALRGGI